MDSLKIVTFNIKCDWKTDSINSFMHRAGLVFEKVMKEMPEIILFQEIKAEHLELLRRMFPEYDFYGHFREKDYSGEGLYTAVLKSRIQLLGYDSYWLSPTPYVPGSRFENQSECPRICITTKLRDKKTGKIFKTLNVHLDHISDEARIDGIKLILDRAAKEREYENIPLIIGGDFNAYPDSETIRYCNEYDKIELHDITDKIGATFHDFGSAAVKIDYIYVTKDILPYVKSTGIWDDSNAGIYLSDHYPVYAIIEN